MAKLTRDDLRLICALFDERRRLDDEIARLKIQRKAISNQAIAEKFEITAPRVAQLNTGSA